jgi:hypothetical protein
MTASPTMAEGLELPAILRFQRDRICAGIATLRRCIPRGQLRLHLRDDLRFARRKIVGLRRIPIEVVQLRPMARMYFHRPPTKPCNELAS